MKKIIAVLLAVAALNGSQPAMAADPQAEAEASALLDVLSFRKLVMADSEGMLGTYSHSMYQSAAVAIGQNPRLDAAGKGAALVKLDQAWPETVRAIRAVLFDPNMMDAWAEAQRQHYMHTYTPDEMRQLAAFYASPLGRKSIAAMQDERKVLGASLQMLQEPLGLILHMVIAHADGSGPKENSK